MAHTKQIFKAIKKPIVALYTKLYHVNIIKKLLVAWLLVRIFMSMINLFLLAFKLPILLPLTLFASIRGCFGYAFGFIEKKIVFFGAILILFFVLCSTIFVFLKQKIGSTLLGIYFVIETILLVVLLLIDLFRDFYLNELVFLHLLQDGVTLLLLYSNFKLLKTEKMKNTTQASSEWTPDTLG